MAAGIIESHVNIGLGEVINNNGYAQSYIMGDYSLSISSSATETSKTATIDFNIPFNTINLIKSLVIKNMYFKISEYNSSGLINVTTSSIANSNATASGSINYQIIYNNTILDVTGDSSITDINFINYLNNYKLQNDELPSDIKLRIITIIDRPATYTDSNGVVQDSTTQASLYTSIIKFDVVYEVQYDGSFILRPSADIITPTQYGALVPHDSTTAYLLVNEEISDEDSTYLFSESGGDLETITASFNLSGAIPKEKIKIIGIKVYCSMKVHLDNINTCNGGVIATMKLNENTSDEVRLGFKKTESWELVCDSIYLNHSFENEINSSIASNGSQILSNLVLNINISTDGDNEGNDMKGGGDYGVCYVSQTYVELFYTTGYNIYHKTNNSWNQVMKAYKKQNGSWIEISENECKSILSNAIVVMKSE